MSPSHGQFCWYELSTPDAAGAAQFYSRVVGWRADAQSQAAMGYTLFNAGETGVAGAAKTPEGGTDGWIGYIAVDDVDAQSERVKGAGGAIRQPPTDIPGIGRFAIAADPHGAVFAMITPASGQSQPVPQSPLGQASWRELMAGDGPAAFSFYADQFGWTKGEGHDMGPMGVYQLFAAGAEPIGGMMTRPPQVPAPHWRYYFRVDSVTAAVGRIAEAGGQVVMGPMQVPDQTWILQGIDPQGVAFALGSEQA